MRVLVEGFKRLESLFLSSCASLAKGFGFLGVKRVQLESQSHSSDKLSGFFFAVCWRARAGQTRSHDSGVSKMTPPDSFKTRSLLHSSSLLLSPGIAGCDEEADFDLTFCFSSFTLKCAYGIIRTHKVKVQ